MKKDIAIIGMSGRFPDADNLSQFYVNLNRGMDSMKPVSMKRISNTTIPHVDYRIGGYIEDIDQFDYEFFNISKAEAEYMDPTQRILMEVVYEAIEDAGYNIDHFRGSRTGIFSGDTNLRYYLHFKEFHPTQTTGNLNATTVGRVARFLDLRGPAIMTDTSCSSSLVALDIALKSLYLDEVDAAIVCGARLLLFPNQRIEESYSDIASPSGKAKVFDAEADGTSDGEAICCILIKPLDQAIEDNDTIYAVIKGSAVNQDAALSSTLTAPSSLAQSEVLNLAWERSGIDPAQITYIEAHGTGTKLGDPIEVEGLQKAFELYTDKKQFCAISSLKSNIGHTDTAAGLASLIKAALALKGKRLFESVNFKRANPLIGFSTSPVYVTTTSQHWELPSGIEKRIAGVSSFGFSGTNCHVVLEEPVVPNAKSASQGDPKLLFISAKNLESLKRNFQAIKNHIDENPDVDLDDLAYTLMVGRKHYDYRCAVLFHSLDDVKVLTYQNTELGIIKWGDSKLPIAICSDHEHVDNAVFEFFLTRSAAFKSYFNECKAIIGAVNVEGRLGVFVFQYCLFNTLFKRGRFIKHFFGNGVGQLVVDVLMKIRSLEEGIKAVINQEWPPSIELAKRCENLLSKVGDKTIFAVELGPIGILSKTLKKVAGDQTTSLGFVEDFSNSTFHKFLKQLYLHQVPIDWDQASPQLGRRIPLPTYQFDRKRCWVSPPLNSDIESWCYQLTWNQSDLRTTSSIHNKRILILMDKAGLGDMVISKLSKENNSFLKIYQSDEFEVRGDSGYAIDFRSTEHLKQVYQMSENKKIDVLINLLGYDLSSAAIDGIDSIVAKTENMVMLFKTFYDLLKNKSIFLTVTVNAYDLDTNSGKPDSLISTFMRGMASEMDVTKNITLDVEMLNPENIVDNIIAELGNELWEDLVAYRGGVRYRQAIIKASGKLPEPSSTVSLQDRKTYLITGGLSGIGFEIAKSIAENYRGINLIILGRTKVFEPQDKSSLTSFADERLKNLHYLDSCCESVEYFSVDVGDKEQMRTTFRLIASKYENIHGVIHSAGLPSTQIPLKHKTLDQFNMVLRPKIYGTALLDELTAPFSTEFFYLNSTLNALIPSENAIEYAVGNAFMDIYIHHIRHSKHGISLNWAGWAETGMKARHAKSMGIDLLEGNESIKDLSTKDALQLFYHSFNLNIPNLIAGNFDLKAFFDNPYFLISVDEEINKNATTGKPAKTTPTHPRTFEIQPEDYSPTLTTTENVLIQIWKHVLKADHLAVDDDFFEKGGNSLLGTQVINYIEKFLHVTLYFDDLLEYGTIHELAKHVDGSSKKVIPFEEIPLIEEQDYYQTSHSQKRLWVVCQLDSVKATYHISESYTVEFLNVDAMEYAFQELIKRHESLRTRFFQLGKEVKQRVHSIDAFPFRIKRHDLTGKSLSQDEINHKVVEAIEHPFDLKLGPLLRVHVFQLTKNTSIIVYVIHHIIADESSKQLLAEEALALYKMQSNQQLIELPILSIQYKDFAAWQNTQLSLTAAGEAKAYWKRIFNGTIPILNIPSDRPRPAYKTYRGARVLYEFKTQELADMVNFCNSQNVTPYMYTAALINAFFHHYIDATDVIIGTPVAGRSHASLENQIGFYVNTLALRTQITGDQSFQDLLQKEKQIVLDAFMHQSYPFDKLIDDLELKRDASRSPLFDVLFNYQSIDDANDHKDKNSPTIQMETFQNVFEVNRFDLTFTFVQYSKNWTFAIQYNTDLFDRERIELMKDHLVALHKQIIAFSDQTLNDLRDKVFRETRGIIKERNSAFDFS